MNLKQVNEVFDYWIVGGSEYQWNCYGPNARYLDYESNYAHGSVLYDTKTQEVYEVSVNDKADKHTPYRWMNPNTVEKYKAECTFRGVNPKSAWDDIVWCDLEVAEDFCTKANAIFNGLDFDPRIEVPLDLEDDLILELALEAHKRDITLNKMVELVLEKAIKEHNKVNETSL
jgi:hypothetical protein